MSERAFEKSRVYSANIIRLTYLIYRTRVETSLAMVKKYEEEEKDRLHERIRELEGMVRVKEEEVRRMERMAEEHFRRHEDDMSTTGSVFSSIFTKCKGANPPSETVLRTRKLEVTDWSDPTFSSDPKMYPLEFKGVTKVIKYKKDEVKADEVWEVSSPRNAMQETPPTNRYIEHKLF